MPILYLRSYYSKTMYGGEGLVEDQAPEIRVSVGSDPEEGSDPTVEIQDTGEGPEAPIYKVRFESKEARV